MKRIIVLLLLFLASCSATPVNEDKHYEYSDVQDYQISYTDVFNQTEPSYYIYYYQVDCYYCHGIKSKMISFALYGGNKVYFVEIDKDYGFTAISKEDTIGATYYLDSFVRKTPQLSKIENGMIVETYIGKEEILLIIE